MLAYPGRRQARQRRALFCLPFQGLDLGQAPVYSDLVRIRAGLWFAVYDPNYWVMIRGVEQARQHRIATGILVA